MESYFDTVLNNGNHGFVHSVCEIIKYFKLELARHSQRKSSNILTLRFLNNDTKKIKCINFLLYSHIQDYDVLLTGSICKDIPF